MFSVNHSTQLFRWIPIWKHSGNWNEFVMSWKNVFDETNDVLLNSTRASDRSFYSIFNKRIYHSETMLAIWRPKKVLSPGSLCWPLVPSPQSKCLKRTLCYPKVSRFSFKYVIKATEMFHVKRKLTYISGANPGWDPLQSSGSRALLYPISIMAQISTKDSGIL